MKPIILFRNYDNSSKEECDIAKEYFSLVRLRTRVPLSSLVVGRYSVLPEYKELEDDLAFNGSKLINSYTQHRWIADFDYYEAIKEFTFESWNEREFVYSDHFGPYIVKGRTNSKKEQYKTHMYAPDKAAAIQVASRLAQDSFIGRQGLIYRKFEPLKSLGVDPVSGINISNEHRCFMYKNKLLSTGYYWDNTECDATFTDEAAKLVEKVADIAKDYVNFYVLDVAQKESGDWVVVEINDAQCAGLSRNNPHTLYRNLLDCIVQDETI